MNCYQKTLNYKLSWTIYLMFFLFCSCSNSSSNLAIDKVLGIKDNEIVSPNINSKLDSIRPLIKQNDIIRLSKFYKLKKRFYEINLVKVNQYADSTISLFNDKSNIDAYKTYYFDALLLKGDALYNSKKHSQAVLYYLKARSFRMKNLDICYNKAVLLRFANVYFIQNQNQKAASFYKECFELEKNCFQKDDPLKHFNELQSLLNNIGFSYEREGMLDSAKYYYQEDLNYIETSRKKGIIDSLTLDNAEIILTDNLGSVYLKQGYLDKSAELLLKSISNNNIGNDGAKIPPLIKLANLYTLKKDYKTAETYFIQSDSLLEKQPDLEFEYRWQKARYSFYLNQNKLALAFTHQQNYINLADSIKKNQAKLSSINIEKDFASLEQKYELDSLAKKNKLKSVYLIFIGFLLTLVAIIAILLKRNNKQSKRNSKIVQLRNQELQETLIKLEHANENYARLMNVMAHDLKNPLVGISSISTFLLEMDNPKDDIESITVIKSAADNAIELINNILNSVLTSQGEKDFIKTQINIQDLVKECVFLLKTKASEKKQRLLLKSNEDIYVLANKEKIWRVLNNIIVNAIKFSYEDTSIELDLINNENKVVISIKDNGIGIPLEFEHKVFDIISSETQRIGTDGEQPFGFGLSISKQIIEAHNGKIWFEKYPIGGTIFFIELPKI